MRPIVAVKDGRLASYARHTTENLGGISLEILAERKFAWISWNWRWNFALN